MWTNFKTLGFALILFCQVLGCGGDPSFKPSVPVFPAKGKLEFQGKPLDGVTLIFNPVDENQKIKPQATTDGEGNFTATTFQTGDGAPEGEFLITLVVKTEESDSAREDAEGNGRAKPAKTKFPVKFQNPTTSTLRVKVSKGQADLGTLEIK
ncbi:MAG: hypothetical protein RL595_3471 [Planctomycetota bacterium]|jgi:hypothetical protein